jgi:Ca2+-binding EF-hand superfamily protein
MATQNVNIGINVSDNGTAKKTVKSFEEITAAATKAQRAAQNINIPVKSTLAPGGTSGSRKASEPTGSQQMTGQQYGSLRGAAGMTGADARDFANQAQGLGGLVRLYATYAANIFAVSAAFSALSNAMDTANLVKGLDQLGAASGTALGTLSKRLVEATDGAISLREAMESTAKASSSGMSSENILRMGKVAKQAAQALGVDMADAVNRLTRGITKLEPELLDELGIFTKVDMATQAYAKSVGKSASAITDFEKRMAFANAVLEEGERKFNAIDFDTNPYTKLLASLKNVAQEGLELVNTVLAPIVRFMSESPKALALAIGALGIALVKQALPALGQFKAGLREAAEESAELAKLRAQDATAAQQAVDTIAEERANATQRRIKDSTDMLTKVQQSNIRAVKDLVSADLTNLTKENLKTINTAISGVETQADAVRRVADTAKKEGEGPSRLKALKDEETALREFANVNRAALAEESRLAKDAAKQNQILSLNQQVAAKAKIESVKDSIVANAAYNGSLIGVTGAIRLMNAELNQSGIQLGAFSKGMLFARAGVAAFAGVVTTVMSSIGGFLNIIATISAAVAFAASFFSKNSKQIQAFDTAITATDDSLLNLGRTLDDITRKPFGQQFNTASLLATATAITEISTSVSGLITKTLAADKAANGFDRFIDGVKTLWGGDLRSQFGKSISSAVFDSFEKLSDSPQAQKAKASIASILDVSPEASKKDFEAAFKSIADNEPKLRQVERAMKDLGMSFGQTADDAQQFDLAVTKSKEAFRSFTDQFKIKDPLAEFALSLVDQSSKTAKALEEPEKAIARLSSIVQDTAQLQLFGSEDQKSLMQYGEQIVNVNKNFEAQKSAVKASNEEVKKLQKALDDLRAIDDYGQQASDEEMAGNRAFEQAKKQLEARREQLGREQGLLQATQTEVTALTARFPQIAANQLIKGADMLSTSISAGFAKGSTAFADAVLGAVGDLPGLAKQRTDMELRKLQSEGNLLKIQASMLQATLANTAQLQRRTAEEAVGLAQSDVRQVGDQASKDRLEQAQKALAEIDKKIAVIKIDPKQALGAIDQIKREIKSGNSLIQKDATELFQYLASLAGNAQQQANNADAQAAVVFKGILAKQAEEIKQKQKSLELDKSSNSLQLQALDLTKQQDGFLSEQGLRDLESVKITAENISGAEKQLAIAQKLQALETARVSGGANAPTQEVYLKERALLISAQESAQAETQNKIKQIGLTTTKDIGAEQQRQVTLQNDLNAIYKQGSDALRDTADKQRDIRNETAKSLRTYTPEYQAEQDAQLQATKIRLQAERDAQALTSQFIITSYRLQAEAKQKLDSGAGPAAIQEVEDRLAAEAAAYGNKVVAVNAARDAELDALKQVEEQRKKTEDFTNLLDVIKNLDSVWTSFGSNLASTITIFDTLTKSQKQYAATVADLEFERDAENDAKKKIEWQQKVDKTNTQSVKAEITGYGKVAGESKKLFKEKTFAYKALAATEKVLHVTRLAMDIKEMVSDTAKTGTSVANSVMRTGADVVEAGVSGVKAVVKAIASLPFPLNIAAGAATAAVVAGLLSQIGGKGPKVGSGGGFTPSSEQRIETQGTGMTWDSAGNKVETEGGIFGDSSAKANSIANSLEILKNNSFDSLSYDNKLLRSFERVADSITGTTNAIISSGIRNIPKELQSLLGSTSSVGKDLGSKIMGFLGGSSKSSTSVTSQRLELSGNFLSAAENINSSLKNVATTVTNWSTKGVLGGLFGGNDKGSSVTDNVLALPDDVRDAFSGILGSLRQGYEEIAQAIGKSSLEASTFVSERLRGVEFKDSQGKPLTFEFKDLKGDELAAELNAFVSQINNISLKNLFPEFDKFKKYGEDFGTTVIKVVQGNRQVDAALRAMGSSFDVTKDKVEDITLRFFSFSIPFTKTISSFELSETIINKMAGSLERFTDQAKFFIDNFLTEAERMATTREDVNAALSELNLSTNLTRDEFKRLVQMQDLSTQAGRDMYQGLMDIQEGFIKTTKRLEDLKTESGNLEIELLKAQGRTVEAEAALERLATEGMIQTELAAYSYNKSLQKQIEALKASETVTNQRINLEQRLLQLGNDTVALRAIELNKLDESNRALQLQIWAVEDYTRVLAESKAATDKATQAITTAENAAEAVRNRATDAYVAASEKVAAAQKSIADLAVEAAKRMQGFGKTLREFVKSQLMPESTAQNAQQAFAQNTRLALAGDTTAIEKVPELAQAAIDAAKASARSSQEFNSSRASILAGVTNVAKFAEAQAALVNIPAEEDPLVVANRTLEDALREQTQALLVANTLGASLIKTPEDLIEQYKKANQDLATAIVEKTLAQEAQARAQGALDAIVGNTGNLIKAITGSTTETMALALVVENELKTGFGLLDANLDGKLSYDELVKGLEGKATDTQIQDLIKAADLNADNFISTYELELFNSTKSIVEALGSGFQMLDTNLDGKVSEAEFIKGMTGKASDAALKTIFDLVDGDNDKLINATELTAAQSVVSATNSADLSSIKEGVTVQSAVTAIAADQTASAITSLNNENLLTITNNTATTVQAINQLLSNNITLFNAMNAVAANTAALANAVQAGSGQGPVSNGSAGNTFLGIFGKGLDVAGKVIDVAYSAVKSVGNVVEKAWKKIFSDERTKKDITLHSRLNNGIGIYDYNYKQPYAEIYGSDRKRGVLAQEVKDQYPSAVSVAANGMYMVDYSKLPVPTDILKFATGGVFSNQVVTRPTSFSLAQMGEAGPEAIMPLSRTRSGQLGVVAQTAPGDSTTREMLNQNAELIQEVRQLREEVSLLRYEARATASATNKTTRILERVTRDGESLLVTDAATV